MNIDLEYIYMHNICCSFDGYSIIAYIRERIASGKKPRLKYLLLIELFSDEQVGKFDIFSFWSVGNGSKNKC